MKKVLFYILAKLMLKTRWKLLIAGDYAKGDDDGKIHDGYIAEGREVLSTLCSSVIDVCYTDVETIYLPPQHAPHPHHLNIIMSARPSPLHPCLPSMRAAGRLAISTQLNSALQLYNYQHYLLQYQPSNGRLASMCMSHSHEQTLSGFPRP